MLMRPIQNKANQTEASGGEDDIQRPVGTRDDEIDPVSYTHLTLPTNREV